MMVNDFNFIVNGLETTTTAKPKSRSHPLFGLMDLSSYTPPPNATVETYSGHSKVLYVKKKPVCTNSDIKWK